LRGQTAVQTGRTVGRIYRMRSTGRQLWLWTQIGIFQQMHGVNGGVADTLDEAKTAFRQTWDGTHADARPVQTKSFTSGPNGGVADSLDEAKAAFRAAGERLLPWRKKRTRYAQPEPICS